MTRILPALRNELAYASVEELGGRLAQVLADRLRIYRRDAARLIEEAADLGPRRALTGEPLVPKLEATAAGQQATNTYHQPEKMLAEDQEDGP